MMNEKTAEVAGQSTSIDLNKIASKSVKDIISESIKVVKAGNGITPADNATAVTDTLISAENTPHIHGKGVTDNISSIESDVEPAESHTSHQSGTIRDRLRRMSQMLKTSRDKVSSFSAPYLPRENSFTLPGTPHVKCSIEIDDSQDDVPVFGRSDGAQVGLTGKQKPKSVHLARLQKMGGCLADSIWRCVGGNTEGDDSTPYNQSKEPKLEFSNLLTIDDVKTNRGRSKTT